MDEDTRIELERLAFERNEAAARLAACQERLTAAIEAAVSAGNRAAEVARVIGVSRQAVAQLLRRQR